MGNLTYSKLYKKQNGSQKKFEVKVKEQASKINISNKVIVPRAYMMRNLVLLLHISHCSTAQKYFSEFLW